eukprot:6280031-Lingulodinium_polyedra.AAC.1
MAAVLAAPGAGSGLVFETFNATGQGQLKERLQRSRAWIFAAQETGLTPGKAAEFSAWAFRKGWKAFIWPAEQRTAGATSAG